MISLAARFEEAGARSLNVLFVMEPELCDLLSPPCGTSWRGALFELSVDVLEDCLCSMRFVWTSLTDVGGGVCLRRAAAAAEEERFALAAWEARKA